MTYEQLATKAWRIINHFDIDPKAIFTAPLEDRSNVVTHPEMLDPYGRIKAHDLDEFKIFGYELYFTAQASLLNSNPPIRYYLGETKNEF